MAEATQRGALLVLAAGIDAAVSDLDAIAAEAPSAHARMMAAPGDVLILTGAGGVLHGFYARLERAFRDIATGLQGQPLAGESWHQGLLDTMATGVPGIRPDGVARAHAPAPRRRCTDDARRRPPLRPRPTSLRPSVSSVSSVVSRPGAETKH